MKKLILFSLFIVFTVATKAAVNIQGRIINADTQQPIEFVTVSIYNPSTSKNIAGALTNQDGVFNIVSVANGTYELRISFVGYSPFNKEFKEKTKINL